MISVGCGRPTKYTHCMREVQYFYITKCGTCSMHRARLGGGGWQHCYTPVHVARTIRYIKSNYLTYLTEWHCRTHWSPLQRAAFRSITCGRYALVWLHPHQHFTTPDRILIRPLNPPSISRPDKWLPSPFVHAKAKVSATSTEKKQLAITKQSVTPGKTGLFWVDWFGMAAGTTLIYTAETVEWTHGVWLVQDDTIRSGGRSLGQSVSQSVHLGDEACLEFVTGL